MHYSKVSCTQCSHYKKCPQKTRMYVNYCGADAKRFQREISSAEIECRTRRGLLFIRSLFSNLSEIHTEKTDLHTAAT